MGAVTNTVCVVKVGVAVLWGVQEYRNMVFKVEFGVGRHSNSKAPPKCTHVRIAMITALAGRVYAGWSKLLSGLVE